MATATTDDHYADCGIQTRQLQGKDLRTARLIQARIYFARSPSWKSRVHDLLVGSAGDVADTRQRAADRHADLIATRPNHGGNTGVRGYNYLAMRKKDRDHPDDRWLHVTSSLNRASILEHGLDWRRMGLANGIARSRVPEQEGCFLVRGDFEAEWFIGMNGPDGDLDVWEAVGIDESDLVESPEGYLFLPGVIPPERVRLIRADIPPAPKG